MRWVATAGAALAILLGPIGQVATSPLSLLRSSLPEDRTAS